MENLIDGWEIPRWGEYVGHAIALSILLRAVLLGLRAWRLHIDARNSVAGEVQQRLSFLDKKLSREFLIEASIRRRAAETWRLLPFWKRAVYWALGYAVAGDRSPDHGLPFLIGTAEILVYPIILKVAGIEPIAFWIAFKCLPQWTMWTQNRSTFNQFLVGNILCVAAAWQLIGFVQIRVVDTWPCIC